MKKVCVWGGFNEPGVQQLQQAMKHLSSQRDEMKIEGKYTILEFFKQKCNIETSP